MPTKRKSPSSAKPARKPNPSSSKKKPSPIPKSWLPPTAPIPEGEPFDLEPDEYYPTGDYWNAIPVFRPTMEQFKDFYTYVRRIRKQGMEHGILKIVPPPEWLALQSDLSEKLKYIEIVNPLRQTVQPGGDGTYQQTNVAQPHTYTVPEWAQLCSSPYHRGPELLKIQRKLRERYEMQERIEFTNQGKRYKRAAAAKTPATTEVDPAAAGPSGSAQATAPSAPAPASTQDAQPLSSGLPTLPTPPHSTTAQSPPADCSTTGDATPTQTQPPASPPAQAPVPPTTSATTESAPSSAPKWDYRRAWMNEYLPAADAANAVPSDWTIDVCTEIETEYWRTLGALRSTGASTQIRSSPSTSNSGALYGADICGTLFDEDMRVWNIGKLDNVLTRMLGCIDENGEWAPMDPERDQAEVGPGVGASSSKSPSKAKGAKASPAKGSGGKGKAKAAPSSKKQSTAIDEGSASAIAGVTTPYLYFGMWQATFSWHVEDMDLCSINYIHFGAPKQWYAIPQKDRKRFETAMEASYPSDARRCKQFLRHKAYLVNPSRLASIKPLKMVQHAGEIVLTFPFGYHSGFNLGFNCAESTNFALDDWVDIGMEAKVCECADREQQVAIDVRRLHREAMEAERRESGEIMEEDEDPGEDEDDESYEEDSGGEETDGDGDVNMKAAPAPTPPPPVKAASKEGAKRVKGGGAVRSGGKGFALAVAAAKEKGLPLPTELLITSSATGGKGKTAGTPALASPSKGKAVSFKSATATTKSKAAASSSSSSSAVSSPCLKRSKKKAAADDEDEEELEVQESRGTKKLKTSKQSDVHTPPKSKSRSSSNNTNNGAGSSSPLTVVITPEVAALRKRDEARFEKERAEWKEKVALLEIENLQLRQKIAQLEGEEVSSVASEDEGEGEGEDEGAESSSQEVDEEEEESSAPENETPTEDDEGVDDGDGDDGYGSSEEKREAKNAAARRRHAENRAREKAGLPIVSRRGSSAAPAAGAAGGGGKGKKK
ncbi:hypothetical protein A4X09_0g1138 [Tilletia walkeri]|uniref:[Histone H3]-trimethyl-L-lysine(9) demethylase n=1 Tax=Tilletia walkeri TaxID=117179 RepID=A0A8X7NFU3_9BASI|nr:hypothetical protein A4X09_0g1138 [Tilletia walkeri]